ncbi:MAG TPA: hypothetical protein VED18_02005 [Candidatus Sulfotelmatobacter sp.]|nr:hypothetical protein [Candidatus Sulfotelmatobacter sp.]
MLRVLSVAGLALLLASCQFQKEADAKFGDQHFKTAIALIELHKIRYGTYPETLKELKFTGEWDVIAISSVEYRRFENGYELNLTRGWFGKPEVTYPPEFWRGIGLVASNVKSGH